MQQDLSNHSSNDPTLLKRKENVNDYMTSTWPGPKKNIEPFFAVNKVRQRKGHQFEGNEEYDCVVDPKTGWRFYKGSRGNMQKTSSGSWANLRAASSSSSNWDQTHWKTSNWNSQHSSSPDD